MKTFLLLLLFLSPSILFAQTPEKEKPRRNTQTGKSFEKIIETSLLANGYEVDTQGTVGKRPNGSKHHIDLIATKDEESILISLKWQQSSGTAEQKIPFELICLDIALDQKEAEQEKPAYQRAHLVLGGNGWSLKEWYLSDELFGYLKLKKNIQIHSLENFLAKINDKKI